MRAAAKNVAYFGAFRNQGHGDGWISRIQAAGLFEQLGRELRIFEINDECVELLLLKTVDSLGENTKALHRDPTGRQNPA